MGCCLDGMVFCLDEMLFSLDKILFCLDKILFRLDEIILCSNGVMPLRLYKNKVWRAGLSWISVPDGLVSHLQARRRNLRAC